MSTGTAPVDSYFSLITRTYKIQQPTVKATENTTIVGNRPRGRPKGSKSKKKTSRDTESAIQEALEAVYKLNAIDKAE